MKALEHLPAVETRDVAPRRALFALLLVFILMIACVAVATAVLAWAKPASQVPQQGELRLGVRLEVDPQADNHRIESEAVERLAQAGWNDEARSSAHIPIDEAMKLLAQQGWPDLGPASKEGAQP
ncbi:hypothetical protein ELI02_28805 (plasmid) [Rhizobium leguminosarum]|uniref:Uncharacterized protein n=1 Tax=Rhizobium leguminosarum TaxID=384 RepID=A0A4Q8XPL5_RHILE|nr:hypothetical protein [Rhizobium leguminosarum]TAX22895.1 hypothetical protein ELI04_33560 [Rhizobium leguminosarum]TAX45730.1 hypothetical protein ELI02_28805 [Rhizobium leguminosarum]TAX46553.1 hypothetical protein ELI01_30755 [Rhizobium leguminosarum]TAX64452.1 hypothetical protein ELI03_35015 [Rhizobium leguminosarum]